MINIDGARLITVNTIKIWSVEESPSLFLSVFKENWKGPSDPFRLLPVFDDFAVPEMGVLLFPVPDELFVCPALLALEATALPTGNKVKIKKVNSRIVITVLILCAFLQIFSCLSTFTPYYVVIYQIPA